MREHRLADIEKHFLGHAADQRFLRVARRIVDEDGDQKGDHCIEERGAVAARLHAVVDGVTDDQRDQQLHRREGEHGYDRPHDLPAVRIDEGPDALDDVAVEGLAEHFLLDAVRADDRPRRAASVFANVGAFGFQFLGHEVLPAPASHALKASSPGRTCRS